MASFRARGVKGLWEGSLGFLEGLSSPGLRLGPQPPRPVPGTPARVAPHTVGTQVRVGWEQLPAPRILQGLFLDPLSGKGRTALVGPRRPWV